MVRASVARSLFELGKMKSECKEKKASLRYLRKGLLNTKEQESKKSPNICH